MLTGTFLVGVSGYVYFAVIGHGRFDAATAAALSATYLLSNILGPGVFIAAEQESSRVISAARAHPGDLDPPGPGGVAPVGSGVGRSTTRRLALICVALGILTLVVLGLCAPVLLTNVLDGDVGLVLALVLCVIGSAAVYYVRGLSGGQQRFRRYAATTAIDGGARIVGCVTLAALGSTNPVAYALALCAGPLAAAVLTGPGARPPAPTPSPPAPSAADLARAVSYLLVASFVSLAMANLAPVIVTGMSGTNPAAATGFAAAVVLSRIPLLLMGPIQALILPRLTLAAGSGRLADFRRDTLLGLAAIGGLAVLAAAVAAIAGRWILTILVGIDDDRIGAGLLVLLTVSAMLQMAVQFLQPALVAVRRHRLLVVAWICGGLAFGLAFLVPLEPIDRGVLATILGPTVTLLIELGTLRTTLAGARTGATPHHHGTSTFDR